MLLLLAILVVSNLIIAFAFNVFSLFLGGSLGNQCRRFLVFIQRFGSKTYRTREIGSRVQHDAFRGFDSDDYRVAVRQLFVALYILADYFILVAIVSAFTFIALFLTLPSLLPKQSTGIKVIKELISTKIVFFGLLGTFLSYMGYHVIFTYIRLFFEEKLHFTDEFLTFAMLLYAGLNIAGTIAAGKLFSHAFKRFFRLLPVFMILCVILMLVLNNSLFMALPLLSASDLFRLPGLCGLFT